MEPINYMGMLPQVNPIQSLTSGLQAGYTLQGIQQQQAARELELQKQQQAQERQQQYAIDLQRAHTLRTPEAFAELTTAYPEQREAFKQSWDMLSADQKKHEYSQGVQVHMALQSKNIPVAKKILETNIQALEASGKDAGGLKQIAEAIDADPESAYTLTGLYLSSVDPDQWGKVVANYTKQKTSPFEIAKAEADAGTAKSEAIIKEVQAAEAPVFEKAQTREQVAKAVSEEWNAKYAPAMKEAGLRLNRAQISNISSQISDRSARFNLDAQKASLDIAEKLRKLSNKASNLSAPSLKMVNDAATNAAIAGQSASQFDGLAKKMDKLSSWSGYAGGGAEFLKRSLGSQDAVSEVKKEYLRLRNDAVIKSLPPGPSTDRDIQIFAAGFPDENANPKVLSSFLRGMAKMQRINSKVEEAKADWVTETGGSLGRSRNEFVAGGYKVKPGQSFADFSQSVARAITQKETKAEKAGTTGLNIPAPKVPTKKLQSHINEADMIVFGRTR